MILYAEDDENDTYFMVRAFSEMGVPERLRTVGNGKLATDYLSGVSPFGDREKYPIPTLLLLDIKMPKMTGLQVLHWVRERPEFSNLTVIMFTSSTQSADIAFCAAHGANAYLAKDSRSDRLSARLPKILEAKSHLSAGQNRLELSDNQLPRVL